MNKPLAFDFDGYELFEGDYVAADKKLYKINKINLGTDTAELELVHVKQGEIMKIVKRKDFEVERLY